MLEGESVSMHFLKVQGYLEKLEKLNAPMPEDIAEDIILGSLPYSYKDFIMHYHMREKKMTMNELHNALKTAEVDMGKTKEKSVLAIAPSSKKIAKNKGKTKTRQVRIIPTQGQEGRSSCEHLQGKQSKELS